MFAIEQAQERMVINLERDLRAEQSGDIERLEPVAAGTRSADWEAIGRGVRRAEKEDRPRRPGYRAEISFAERKDRGRDDGDER